MSQHIVILGTMAIVLALAVPASAANATSTQSKAVCEGGVLYAFEPPTYEFLTYVKEEAIATVRDPNVITAEDCAQKCYSYGEECVMFNFHPGAPLYVTPRCNLKRTMAENRRLPNKNGWQVYVVAGMAMATAPPAASTSPSTVVDTVRGNKCRTTSVPMVATNASTNDGGDTFGPAATNPSHPARNMTAAPTTTDAPTTVAKPGAATAATPATTNAPTTVAKPGAATAAAPATTNAPTTVAKPGATAAPAVTTMEAAPADHDTEDDFGPLGTNSSGPVGLASNATDVQNTTSAPTQAKASTTPDLETTPAGFSHPAPNATVTAPAAAVTEAATATQPKSTTEGFGPATPIGNSTNSSAPAATTTAATATNGVNNGNRNLGDDGEDSTGLAVGLALGFGGAILVAVLVLGVMRMSAQTGSGSPSNETHARTHTSPHFEDDHQAQQAVGQTPILSLEDESTLGTRTSSYLDAHTENLQFSLV